MATSPRDKQLKFEPWTDPNAKPKQTTTSDVTPNQPAGTNAEKDSIVITGLRASIQDSLNR